MTCQCLTGASFFFCDIKIAALENKKDAYDPAQDQHVFLYTETLFRSMQTFHLLEIIRCRAAAIADDAGRSEEENETGVDAVCSFAKTYFIIAKKRKA